MFATAVVNEDDDDEDDNGFEFAKAFTVLSNASTPSTEGELSVSLAATMAAAGFATCGVATCGAGFKNDGAATGGRTTSNSSSSSITSRPSSKTTAGFLGGGAGTETSFACKLPPRGARGDENTTLPEALTPMVGPTFSSAPPATTTSWAGLGIGTGPGLPSALSFSLNGGVRGRVAPDIITFDSVMIMGLGALTEGGCAFAESTWTSAGAAVRGKVPLAD